MTSKLGATSAKEVADLASFTSIIQVVFALMFCIDVSMITVSSVEATAASTILTAFSAAGSGLSTSTSSGGSTQMTALIIEEFVSQRLSYTASSLSAIVEEPFL